MDRILGQRDAVAALEAALAGGRFPHAWIFSGPRGVGKHTTALAVARRLLGPGDGPLIDAGTHPDLHVIRKELARYCDDPEIRRRKLTNIPMDVLRQWMIGGTLSNGRYFEPAIFKTSVLGRGKVFIVDEAELLSVEVQDAMLKSLEEPPPRTWVFLLTTRPQQLRPTVHSRCAHLAFGPLDDEAMLAWLERSGLRIDASQRDFVLAFAAGSPGTAVLAVEHELHRWHRVLAPMLAELDRGAYPAAMGETIAGLIDEFAAAQVKADAGASKTAANRDGAAHLLWLLAAHARRRLAGTPDGEAAMAAIDAIHAAETQLARNVNMKLVMENLVAQWVTSAR